VRYCCWTEILLAASETAFTVRLVRSAMRNGLRLILQNQQRSCPFLLYRNRLQLSNSIGHREPIQTECCFAVHSLGTVILLNRQQLRKLRSHFSVSVGTIQMSLEIMLPAQACSLFEAELPQSKSNSGDSPGHQEGYRAGTHHGHSFHSLITQRNGSTRNRSAQEGSHFRESEQLSRLGT